MEIYDENLAIFLEKLVYEHREYSSDVQPVDSVSTVNLEALPVLSSNLTDSSSVVIVERGESEASETSNSAVELYLEHQKNYVNASGWNEYIISITNPNERDIHKTSYLEGTQYNWDTLQVTVPVPLKATGERNIYIFKVSTVITENQI